VAGGNFSQTGTGTFSTGIGAVTLNGPTTVANSQSLTLDRGNLSVAGGNFNQIGAGTFSTGTGNVSLNGNTTLTGTLTVTGPTTLNNTLDVTGDASVRGALTANNGGSLNGVTIGASMPAAGSFTNLVATTVNAGTVNATTVNASRVAASDEVTTRLVQAPGAATLDGARREVGFFGASANQQSGPRREEGSVHSEYDGSTQTAINNVRGRVSEIEDALRAYGLLR